MDVAELTRKAEAGRCAAQATLGMYYLFGYESLPVDYDKAFSLLSAAAEQGATRAIANLADMYAQGLGTPRDLSKAIELYESVGHWEFWAALALGRIYASGLHGDVDPQKARYWYSVVARFEGPGFNYEALCSELTEAKEYMTKFFRVLQGLPAYGPLPMGFSPDGRGLHREGYVIEFLPDAPSAWIGNFQPGFTQIDTVVEYPDGHHVLVVAHGQGYVVDSVSRRLVRVLQSDIRFVLPLRDRHQLLLGTDLRLELVGRDGPVWQTRRISWDGMESVRREGDQVKGLAWNPVDDTWEDFVLDLDSGQVKGGSYPAELSP